jgi:site-specific DNA-methyltransferase (adenine-specific)
MSGRVETIGDCTLYLGDCLEILPTLGKVDAVVTDPPYSSGAHESAKRGKRSALTPESVTPRDVVQGDVMGTFGFLWFLRVWFRQFLTVLSPGGHLACCIDWRMYPIVSAMADAAGMKANNMVVWDKGYPGLGTGFRAQHELVLLASNGAPTWHSYDHGNVIKDMRVTSGEHPHEKPQALMSALIETCSPLDGTVADTFMGSGSTGVACVNLGRRFIGIEVHEPYFDIACRRIEEAYRQPRLFAEPAPKPQQVELL